MTSLRYGAHWYSQALQDADALKLRAAAEGDEVMIQEAIKSSEPLACLAHIQKKKQQSTHGVTELMLAARNGHSNIVDMLIAAKAGLDAQTSRGCAREIELPTWLACAHCQARMARSRSPCVPLLLLTRVPLLLLPCSWCTCRACSDRRRCRWRRRQGGPKFVRCCAR